MDTTKIKDINRGNKANLKITILSVLLLFMLLSVIGFSFMGSFYLNKSKEKEQVFENLYEAKLDIISSYNTWLHWLTYKDADVQNIIQDTNSKVSQAETSLVSASSNIDLASQDSNALSNKLNNITDLINTIKARQDNVASNLNEKYVTSFLDNYELLISNMENIKSLVSEEENNVYILWGYSILVFILVVTMLFLLLKISQDYRGFSNLNYASAKIRHAVRGLEKEARSMKIKREGGSFPLPHKKYSVNSQSPLFSLNKRLNTIKEIYIVYFTNLRNKIEYVEENSTGFLNYLEGSKESLEASHKKLQKNLLNVKEAYDLTQNNRNQYQEMVRRSQENKKIIVEAMDLLSKITGRNNVIRESVQDSSKKTKRVGESSQSISQAIDLITSVSKKIHVLALNTAIQASHSSAHGSRFSTIAQEIERLAKNSSAAAKKIEASVSNIHDDAKAATVAMENTTKEVVDGTRNFEKKAELLKQAKDISEGFDELIEQLAQSEEKQDILMKSVYDDFYNMDELMSEASRAVEDSIRQVDSVQKAIEDYRKLLKIVDQQ